MDFNSKNVMISGLKNQAKLIDFEYTEILKRNHEFLPAYYFGYLYNHWLHKYISEDEYDSIAMPFIESMMTFLGAGSYDFSAVYSKFKKDPIRREMKYKIAEL